MNKRFALVLSLVAAASLVAMSDADARRIGGGRSLGAQRAAPPAITKPAPSTTPSGAASDPVMPRTAAAPPAAGAAAAKAPAAGASRWLGPLAGIAAGLGLAALMSHMGLSESFGSFLLLLLLVGAGIFVVRMFLARRMAPAQATPGRSPLQRAMPVSEPVFAPVSPPVSEPAFAARPASVATTTGNPSHWPAGFDAPHFAQQALAQFREVQLAFDRADRAALSAVMTPALLAEVSGQLNAGGLSALHTGSVFPTLDAEVLDVTTEGIEHWVSVRFHGTVREDGSLAAEPFDEQWNLVKPVDDSTGWLIAGIQQTIAAP